MNSRALLVMAALTSCMVTDPEAASRDDIEVDYRYSNTPEGMCVVRTYARINRDVVFTDITLSTYGRITWRGRDWWGAEQMGPGDAVGQSFRVWAGGGSPLLTSCWRSPRGGEVVCRSLYTRCG
jgi:hypothetical protein